MAAKALQRLRSRCRRARRATAGEVRVRADEEERRRFQMADPRLRKVMLGTPALVPLLDRDIRPLVEHNRATVVIGRRVAEASLDDGTARDRGEESLRIVHGRR
jgi:hypothetical protein